MVKKIRRLPRFKKKSRDHEFYHEVGTIPGTIIVDENAEQPIIF